MSDKDSTNALGKICDASQIQIIADIHFHYKRGIEAADAGAACLELAGNIGNAAGIAEVVAAAKANSCSIRIGVNAGSLEKNLLENMLDHVQKHWLNLRR